MASSSSLSLATAVQGDWGPQALVSITRTAETNTSVTYGYTVKFDYNDNYTISVDATWKLTRDGTKINSGSKSVKNNAGVHTVGSGSFTIDKSTSGKTVDIMIEVNWGGWSWGTGYNGIHTDERSLTIDAKKALTTPSINGSTSIKAPKDSLTISWTNSPGSSHTQQLIVKSNNTEIINTSLAGDKTSYDVDLKSYEVVRGKNITATIKAISGDISSISSSSTSSSVTVCKINSLPNYPAVTRQSDTSLTMQNSISFTVTAGDDDDKQETSLYYSLDGGVTKDVFTSPLVITHDTDGGGGVISGSNTISFYTYDGYEYSTATTKTFTATFAPVIGSVNTAHTYIENMSGNTSTLVSKTDITFSMDSGTVKSISLYLRSGSSSTLSGDGNLVSTDKYTYNDSTRTITITTSDIASLVSDGYYYQFAFTVSDGVANSTKTNWQTVARKPSAPVLPTFNSIVNDGLTSEAKSNYYKNKVKITFTNPSNSATRAKVTSIVIVASYGGTKEYTCSTTAGQKTLELDLSQVNGNATTTFKFKITDAAGQTKTSEAAFATMTKSSALAFGGNVINVSNDNLKPNTNTADFDIAHPFAQASGTNNIIYSYEMQISSTKATIAEYSVINTNDPTQKTIRVAAGKINAYALTLVTNYDLAYDTTIRVRATDGFGSIIELTKTIKVNFTEPPVFVTNTFDIKHDYLTGTSTVSTSTGTKITSTSALNIRMVNSGEGIIFVLPKATDPNNDIAEYRIFLSRNDFYDTSSVLKYNEVTFGQTPWLTIPYTTLENGTKDSNYYYYLFKASQYTKNEYFYFKLQARDESGNTSKEIICQNYIIGCRTVAPTFSAGNVKVERNGTEVTLSYNFRITDLGGSAKSTGWDRAYYDNFPNFERTITNYTPKASLVIEIAPDQSFTKDVITSSPITYTASSSKKLADFTHTQTKLSGFAASHAKIFMRFTLTVSYTLVSGTTTANVVSIPQVYTYFGAVPTVAHRAHKVGINTNSLDQDDVLVVENYQGTKYIRFKGTDASNASKTYEITFDLLSGSITGAVIDCGEW